MNRIKELRQKNNLTQVELAKKLNITQANLSGWENQKWQPDQQSLIKMSNLFTVSVDYILCNDNNYTVPDNLKDVSLAFSGGMEDLTQDDLDEVSRFIEFLKSKKKDR